MLSDNIKPSLPNSGAVIPWRAQPGPQLQAIQQDLIPELLYGGAVFGGKSDYLLGDFAQDVPQVWGKHWHGILFRQSYPELEDLISRSKEIYPPWFPGVHWSNQTKTWTWPNGATLKMRHMESDDDWMLYWGQAYTWIGFDEIALWASPIPYQRMKARLRCAQYKIPNMRIRASANPGGPGHQWVKAHWKIDQYPQGGMVFEAEDGSQMKRLFIKSRLSDNKIGIANDPTYPNRLKGTGSEQFVRAITEGDWAVIEGAYFPEFRSDKHIIAPFEIPSHWARIRAMDWGSAKPFCIHWGAVSDGSCGIPRGAIVIYREWYGWNGNPNEGCKLTAQEVGRGIRLIEAGKPITEKDNMDSSRWPILTKDDAPLEKVSDEVLDPAAFSQDGGPSIAERMDNNWRRADNARVARGGAMGGWDQVRDRLKGEEEKPMLYFFSTCVHIIRTLPAMQHDKHKAEDLDSNGEDHAPDTTRYLCMSRPITRDKPRDNPARYETQLSINELIKRQTQKRLAER